MCQSIMQQAIHILLWLYITALWYDSECHIQYYRSIKMCIALMLWFNASMVVEWNTLDQVKSGISTMNVSDDWLHVSIVKQLFQWWNYRYVILNALATVQCLYPPCTQHMRDAIQDHYASCSCYPVKCTYCNMDLPMRSEVLIYYTVCNWCTCMR